MNLTQEELDWLAKQPKPVFGDLLEEMNKRFLEYDAFSYDKRDMQVRQDFAIYGAQDESIVLVEDIYVRR